MLSDRDLYEYDPDEPCGWCDGEGYVERDCEEDTCCCADPIAAHGLRVCEYCHGKG